MRYEKPALEVVLLQLDDVIKTSGGQPGDENRPAPLPPVS